MDYKKTNAPTTTVTRNMADFVNETGNVYESVAIIGKRSNQIAAELKEELLRKLNEFSSTTDNLEEQFENHEQIEISRYYERQPKPTLIATQDFIEDKVYNIFNHHFRYHPAILGAWGYLKATAMSSYHSRLWPSSR